MNHQIGSLRKFSATGYYCAYSYDVNSGEITKVKYVPSEERLFICLKSVTVKPDDDELRDRLHGGTPDELMMILCYNGVMWIHGNTTEYVQCHD
jgi:hypothetical protein